MELIKPAYVGVDEPLGRWLTLYKLDLEVAVQKIFKRKRRSVAGQGVFFILFWHIEVGNKCRKLWPSLRRLKVFVSVFFKAQFSL